MARRLFTLANDRLRGDAIACIRDAKPNSRVEIKGPKRSNDQNAAMWAMLGDIAEQLAWHGRRLDPDQWKRIFLNGLRQHYKHEMMLVPNLDGTGWVDLSPVHSSDLDGPEMHDLLTLISAFGDEHAVAWSAPAPKDDGRPTPPIEAYEGAA